VKYVVTALGLELPVEVLGGPGGPQRVRVLGKEYDVEWKPALGTTHWLLGWHDRRQVVVVEPRTDALGVTLDIEYLELRVQPARAVPGRPAQGRGEGQVEEVRAPRPGLLVAVEVRHGQAVAMGATVAVIEAMKMQMELPSPAAGTVREVRVRGGSEVSAGEVIAVLVPDSGGGSAG
jgi:biotin carboxyl carrier protein